MGPRPSRRVAPPGGLLLPGNFKVVDRNLGYVMPCPSLSFLFLLPHVEGFFMYGWGFAMQPSLSPDAGLDTRPTVPTVPPCSGLLLLAISSLQTSNE